MEEKMLELKDICFNVRQDSKEKEILKNINLKIDERFVAITDRKSVV